MVDAEVRVVQQVAAIGRLDEFNPANDSITTYVERAQLYMEANSVYLKIKRSLSSSAR